MRFRTIAHTAAVCIPLAALTAFLAAGCSDDPAARHGSSVPPDTITLVAWNVENFYDLVDDGSEYPEYKPGACGWDRFTFEVKLHNVATVLASVHADVAVLSEVENANVVERLCGELRRRGIAYPYTATGDTPRETTNRPAVLSKYPIVAHRGIGTVFVDGYWSRNILEAHIDFGGDTLIVFANHWPSKRHPESYRVATARKLAARLRELAPGTDYIIAGDLNADYGECETFLTAGLDDSRGLTGINHILGTTDSPPNAFVDYVYESELRNRTGLSHYDLWLELPEEHRGCRVHRGQWSTPDHLLVPPALYDRSGINYVDNSFCVFTMGDSLLRHGEPYRWVVAYRGTERFHIGRGFSDHLPIMARFVFSPFAGAGVAPSRQPRPANHITFESGMEGWLGHTPGVTLHRETPAGADGYALRIEGTTRTANGTVALARIPRWQYTHRTPSRIRLRLKGHAAFCLRVRAGGARRWTYYAPPLFEPSGRASYVACNLDEWRDVALRLPQASVAGDGLEIEVRVLEQSAVDVWLDDIVVH